jgi:hypothetical protein
VGLAIDYAFYVQSSQQVSRAAAAAATQAVRTAAAGYALDIANNKSVAQATADSVSEGELAGQQWFAVQADDLVRGSAGAPVVTVTATSTGAAGFAATVNYTFTYPPFFNVLFNRTSNWIYPNSSSAQSLYQYVEVVLVLDTSGSMLIGANQSDITSLSDNSVCFPSSITSTAGDVPLVNGGTNIYPTPTYDSLMAADSDQINFSQLASATNSSVYTYTQQNGSQFPASDPHDLSGKCNTAQGFGVLINGNTSASQPGTPCSLACHTSTSTANGNFTDPYGEARALGVTLRLDVVLKAAEQVAQDLYTSEQTSNQFTLGVYQFNNDVSAIVDGGSNAEATTDLTGAKATIENYDYSYKGNSSLLPTLLTNSNPNTNFPLAITHLVSGGGTVPQLQQVTNTTSNPAGGTAANPIKNIFIVTDGLEDSSSANAGGGNGLNLDFGEMTSSTAENYYTANGSLYNGNATGYCSELKKLGFNVYVLYVTYYPLPFVAYYAPYLGEQANYADVTDYPSVFNYGGSGSNVYPRILTQPTATAETIGTNPDPSNSATSGEVSPTEESLQSCASNGDFKIASSAADITNAMTAMLKAAINSSIILTH